MVGNVLISRLLILVDAPVLLLSKILELEETVKFPNSVVARADKVIECNVRGARDIAAWPGQARDQSPFNRTPLFLFIAQ